MIKMMIEINSVTITQFFVKIRAVAQNTSGKRIYFTPGSVFSISVYEFIPGIF